MISRVKLENIATYTNPVEVSLKDINFFYGGNGTGKTTLSKVISGELSSPECVVDNSNVANERLLVYNKSFVDRNFREVGDISGIFTLGSNAGDLLEYIKGKEQEFEHLHEEIEKKKDQIKQLEASCTQEDMEFQDRIWQTQIKYGAIFPKAMVGARGAKQAFKKKCLEVFAEMDAGTAKTQSELENVYHAAYSKESTTFELYDLVDIQAAKAVDSHELLPKKITGKADSDIGRFIEYLESSDWVKKGMVLAQRVEGRCPYCAQVLPQNIKTDIEDFFDEEYQRECNVLQNYIVAYKRFHKEIIDQLKTVVSQPYIILQYDQLKDMLQLYISCVEKNEALLVQKNNAPSQVVTIDSTINFLEEINKLLAQFNEKITQHNTWVRHQNEAQLECSKDVWRLIVAELSNDILSHLKTIDGKQTAIQKFKEQKGGLDETATQIETEIKEKKASISSVEHTVISINKILEGYGFSGFKLAENELARGTYKIVRRDGSDAKASLSEGEYNFITFLYFYHLIFGSTNAEDIQRTKVIIIDDPISSLDSNVLFIVSSLVKNIIQFCRNGEQAVKQVIISTHNIYFHKEITFVGARDHWPTTRTGFFIIRKKNEVSSITSYSENQIQSSYEMLWSDIRNPGHGSAKSIFNTMRRILENYFNIIGGIDYEKCVNQFEGEDKVICKSLISCINEQSHTISDDYFMCVEDSEIEQYLRIFAEIFDKMGHKSHYNMMMRLEG